MPLTRSAASSILRVLGFVSTMTIAEVRRKLLGLTTVVKMSVINALITLGTYPVYFIDTETWHKKMSFRKTGIYVLEPVLKTYTPRKRGDLYSPALSTYYKDMWLFDGGYNKDKLFVFGTLADGCTHVGEYWAYAKIDSIAYAYKTSQIKRISPLYFTKSAGMGVRSAYFPKGLFHWRRDTGLDIEFYGMDNYPVSSRDNTTRTTYVQVYAEDPEILSENKVRVNQLMEQLFEEAGNPENCYFEDIDGVPFIIIDEFVPIVQQQTQQDYLETLKGILDYCVSNELPYIMGGVAYENNY